VRSVVSSRPRPPSRRWTNGPDTCVHVAVLAATGRLGGITFHAELARQAGASTAELVSAVLVGMPAVGLGVVDALPLVAPA